MIFANIAYLFLLILLIPYILWYIFRRKKTEPTMQVSMVGMYRNAPKSWKVYLLHLKVWTDAEKPRRLICLTTI